MYKFPWLSINESAFVGKIKVKQGRTTFINWGCYISDYVEIGEGVLFGPSSIVHTSSHQTAKGKFIKDQKVAYKKVIIGDDVWIGAGAIILGGNVIKSGAVIGAGSVLTEDHVVGENEIWVGNPCKFLKMRE